MTFFFFFFNDTATTEIYTLSLHDALPISFQEERITKNISSGQRVAGIMSTPTSKSVVDDLRQRIDRKSTRLNSSHANISYAVFCLKKKKHNDLSHRRGAASTPEHI